MDRIALIGTGVMGEPMARNLLAAGRALTVFNRTAARCEPLRALGATATENAADAIAGADAIILMLPTQKESDEVLRRGADGRIGLPVSGKTVVLMATVAPAYSKALATSLVEAGADYVEAPVSGSRGPAERGELVIMAAASEASSIERVQPLFDVLGKRTIRCGAPPTAMRMKLAAQLMLSAWFETIAEAAHFAKGVGLDLGLFLEMIEAGPLANDVLRSKTAKLLAEDFAEQAAIRHVAKDVGLVCDEAERAGLWVPIARENRRIYGLAMARGQSQDDAIGLLKLLRDGEP